MNLTWPQINSIVIRSSKELRKKFLLSEALKKKCCLSESSSEFISFSVTAKKFSSSFGEHASFGSFLEFIPILSGLRKEHRKNLLVLSYQVTDPVLSGKKVQINNYRKVPLC